MKQLYNHFRDQVQFLTDFVREAHPGSAYRAHRTFEQRMDYARDFQHREGIPWPIVVDGLAGTVHPAYGERPDNSFLIDAEGRIAFEVKWSHAPTLFQAISELLERGGSGGPVHGGVNRAPHLLASMVNGLHGIERGGEGAIRDLALSAPPAVAGMYAGHWAKPLLGPIALRERPLPAWPRLAIGLAALAVLGRVLRRAR
jgi:hypothetical protein